MTDVDDQPATNTFVLNTVLVVGTSALAIAFTSWLWHHIHPACANHTGTLDNSYSPTPSLAVEKDRKSTRSKERRRRGKDPFRDLLKGSKKSKALLKTIKVADHEQPPPSVDTLSNASVPGNDSASSTSRSHSPDSPRDFDPLYPRLCSDSDDGSSRIMIPNASALAVSSPLDSPSDACSHSDVVSPDSITAMDAEVNLSSASTIIAHVSDASEPVAGARTPEPRISQPVSTSGSCAELFRARTRLRMSKMDQSIKTPLVTPDSVASPFPSIHAVAPCPSLSIAASTHSTDGAGPSTPTNSWGSTPPPPPSTDPSQPPGMEIQLASLRDALEAAQFREDQLRIEAEQASKERDELCWKWNEDAGVWRRREAELQAQIHHLMSQLQAYAAVASFQPQPLSPGFPSPSPTHVHASPRLQHPPLAPFPLPPAIQPQNSASAPAHVQALLASAPMLSSHPVGFAAPANGGFYPSAGLGMSPLLWSGLGLCVPSRDTKHGRRTPDSSTSGSSSRGRRRRRRTEDVKSTSDESSMGDCDGVEGGSADEDGWEEEEEEDIFSNNALADAILKRPESIRGLSNAGKRSEIGRASSGARPNQERMDALKDPALEQPGSTIKQ